MNFASLQLQNNLLKMFMNVADFRTNTEVFYRLDLLSFQVPVSVLETR